MFNIKKSIDDAFIYLLENRPFYGAMLSSFNMRISSSCPSVGVGYDRKNKKLMLVISPQFWEKLTDKERVAVLTHECDHVLNKHIIDYDFLGNKQIANLAMDIHINQGIPNLPKGCMQFYNFQDSAGQPFKPNLSTVDYYELLDKEDCQYRSRPGDPGENDKSDQNGDQKGKGEEQYDKEDEYGKYKLSPITKAKEMDEHTWDQMSQEERMQAVSDLLKRSIDKTQHGHGTDINKAKELLENILEKYATLDYSKLLQKAIKKSLPAKDREATWYRPNKRHGYIAPGSRAKRTPRVDFYIDSSGSMSVREINFALATVDKFLTIIENCNINLFHTEVYNTQKYKKGHKVKEDEFESGGTDLQPVMDKISKCTADLCIIMTDGYYGDVTTKLTGKKVLFLITKDGTVDHPLKRFGETIKMKEGTN